jgi:hypothetical protein
MTALLTGTLGPARIEGKAQLKGSLADWKTGQLAVQLGASAVDGGRLLAQFVPNSAPIQGAPLAPGTFSLRMNGTLQRLETSAAVETRPLQARLDGTTNLTAGSLQFAGKLSASSPAPEAFMAAPVLMLLGGEPASGLRVETNLTMTPGRFEASKLNAVSAKNAVSGRISFDASGSVPVLDADLKADRISAPALLAYFVSSEPSQLIVLTGNNPASAAQDIWTDRPFSPSAFQNASARVSLDAKTLKISDAISLTDGRAAAELRNGRLEIQKLEGKTLGGELTASLRLEAQGKGIAATTRLSLSNFDLAEAPEGGTPALLTGRASISLTASGLALSPRGIVSNLQGRGNIVLSDGQISKLSPPAVQKGAEELLAGQLPLTEDVITKKISEVSQSEDFKFQHLKVPFVIRDGMLEIRRASFRSRDGTVRMQAYLDMAKMQADSTWQAGVSSDRQAKWPPVKILISGQLRELGARPRSVGAEDFVRAVLVKKMEGDINRLENLNKPQAAAPAAAPAPPAWTAKQEPAQRTGPHKKREDGKVQRGAADANASRQQPQALPGPSQRTDFESRMRDILRGAGNTDPRAQRSP